MHLKQSFNWQNLFKDRTQTIDFDASKGLTPEQSIKVFDAIAKMDGVVHSYIHDGCHARAHLVCRALTQVGIEPKKAWVLGEQGNPLSVGEGEDEALWRFHVAPTLPVQQKNGTVEQMVFDPSLFDGPATVEQWTEKMGGDINRTTVMPLGMPPFTFQGDYDLHRKSSQGNITLDAQMLMKDHKKWANENYVPPFKSELRTSLLIQKSQDPAIAFLREMNMNKG